MKPVRSPKKGQAPFIIFHSNFRVKNRTLIQIRVLVLFYFPVSSASVLELAGTAILILLPFANSASASWFLPSALYDSPRLKYASAYLGASSTALVKSSMA